MNKEEIFSIWSPADSVWSPWVKPVLFAHLDSVRMDVSIPEFVDDLTWMPSSHERTALVLDLPGAEGISAAPLLADRGYRPVPLYNALPLPVIGQLLHPMPAIASAMVDMLPVAKALIDIAPRLAAAGLSPDSPPAFLLAAGRMADGLKPSVNQFDNRSICFTTDFPSANFLLSKQIERALLVQRDRLEPRPDLAHVLRRWQDGGITLERKSLAVPGNPEKLMLTRPPWYGVMFQRILSSLGLRRASSGGFGAWVGGSSSGG